MENKNIDSHNNDRVEEFDQVETNNNMKLINRHCGTYDIKFQISKALLANKSNPLSTIWVKCYAKSNNDRLHSVVLQIDSNSSVSSYYNSDDKNSNRTKPVQSSINDNSSNDGKLFPLSITDND